MKVLDIDKDVVFKNYQCNSKSISLATKLDFSYLEKFDTFKATNGRNEMMIVSEEG